MINEETGILEAPFNLITLSKATGNPMLDLGYQCCDLKPYFEYQNDNGYKVYLGQNPNNILVQEVNVYLLETKIVMGLETDVMKYIGSTSSVSGKTIVFENVTYTYTETIKNIRGFYINQWSRCKPYALYNQSQLTELTDEQKALVDVSFGFDIYTILGDSGGSTTIGNVLRNAKQYKDWAYIPPKPNQVDYFRMTDFVNYNPNAQVPFTYLHADSYVTYKSKLDLQNDTETFLFKIYKNLNAEIQITEFNFIENISSFDNWKYGLITASNTNLTDFKLQTGYTLASDSDEWNLKFFDLSDGLTIIPGCYCLTLGLDDETTGITGGTIFLPQSYFEFELTKLRFPIYANFYSSADHVEDFSGSVITQEVIFYNGQQTTAYLLTLKSDIFFITTQSELNKNLNPPPKDGEKAKANCKIQIVLGFVDNNDNYYEKVIESTHSAIGGYRNVSNDEDNPTLQENVTIFSENFENVLNDWGENILSDNRIIIYSESAPSLLSSDEWYKLSECYLSLQLVATTDDDSNGYFINNNRYWVNIKK